MGASREQRRVALELKAVRKSYGGTLAVDGVDLRVAAGEVHALLGENGAGKSTLMKIASGLVAPDGGEVLVDGASVATGSVAAMQAVGVGLIHQEPRLFGDLDVVDNVFLGQLPRRGLRGVDWALARRRTQELLDRVGARVSPRARVGTLSVADKQLVDMASALLREPSVLIVDEPTAALTPSEVTRLFGILSDLRADGVAIVFIGHRLEEVFAISDRITVLRDGRHVAGLETARTNADEVIRHMVGRAFHATSYAGRRTPGDVALAVDGLSSDGAFAGVSFELRAGEIVALAGLVGAGRSEVAETIFGVRRRSAGTVRLGADGADPRGPADAVRRGLALVPEDRGHAGLHLPLTIAENITLPQAARTSWHGWRRPRRERAVALEAAGDVRVVARHVLQQARELSGGNQQKVSMAKWLATRPRVLIVDEPTRGVDVGAKGEIHRLLHELAQEGLAVLMISSDLTEVLALSDRILVMREGRITGELSHAEADEERVIRLATGQADVVGGVAA